MQATSAIRVEENVDRAASALFATACGYAAYAWLATHVAQPTLSAETFAAAAFAYVLANCSLSSFQPDLRRPPVPVFDVREIETVEAQGLPLTERPELTELLLTERFEPPEPMSDEPLRLDDLLAELSPDSRVVRLFDPSSMPTPAQLKSRIDQHLGSETPAEPPADGVEALHEALAELRRSLR